MDELSEKRIKANRRYRRRLNDEYSGKPEFQSTLKEMLTALDQRFFQIQMESWNEAI